MYFHCFPLFSIFLCGLLHFPGIHWASPALPQASPALPQTDCCRFPPISVIFHRFPLFSTDFRRFPSFSVIFRHFPLSSALPQTSHALPQASPSLPWDFPGLPQTAAPAAAAVAAPVTSSSIELPGGQLKKVPLWQNQISNGFNSGTKHPIYLKYGPDGTLNCVKISSKSDV